MKKAHKILLFYFCCFILSPIYIKSQEIDKTAKLDSLISLKHIVQNELNEIEAAINEINLESISSIETIEILIKDDAKVRQAPNPFENPICIIESGSTVTLLGINDSYLLVELDDCKGFINEMYVEKTELLASFKELQDQENKDLRREKLIEEYGAEGNFIANGDVWIGMTKSMLFESRGYYKSKREMVTDGAVYETLYYEDKTIYTFIDGKLDSWHE